MNKFVWLILLFLLIEGCVEQIDLPHAPGGKRIVVDGLITDQPGPYTVKIFQTSELDEYLKYPDPVINATVKIVDDLGNEELLQQGKAGYYITTNLQGTIGRKYKLQFTTTDDRSYESSLQELLPGGAITALSFEFVANAINRDDVTKVNDVVRIYIDAKGNQTGSNLFRWRWSGVYEIRTFPEYRQRYIHVGDTGFWIPDPLPCSGFTVSPDYQLVPIGVCECCSCWATEFSDDALVSNNRVLTQAEFSNVRLAELPLHPEKFFVKYYLKAEQLSVSQEVYTFWKNIQSQQEGNQDIFQPNVIHIKGNITSLTDPDEEVSGIFAVSGVVTKDIFIKRSDIPAVIRIDSLYEDCRQHYPGSTNVKPDFW